MLKRYSELEPKPRAAIRGGAGRGTVRDYLAVGEMAGVRFVSRVTLEPGASVGVHPHPREEELYVILEGTGTARVDDEGFPVGPGDAFLCKAGHRHGLCNDGPGPLAFLAVLTEAEK